MMFSKNVTTVVYRSLDKICTTLRNHAGITGNGEIRNILSLCADVGLVDDKAEDLQNKTEQSAHLQNLYAKKSHPFIVIEGLDGTGKTTLTKHISKSLNLKLMSTPPKNPVITRAREYFDSQDESLRRAFYSLGNYLAALEVIKSNQPVVMDRFWHSTAAYAMTHRIKKGGPSPSVEELIWPNDLLQPDLVIFIQVSEQERIRRHTLRNDFTNTEEEKTLAADNNFRKNLVDCYRRITGPQFLELNVDGDQPIVEEKVVKAVLENFPKLSSIHEAQNV